MPLGPGKYDTILTQAREQAGARGAILIVLEGNQGFGFSCQAAAFDLARLPGTLRAMADEIERDQQAMQPNGNPR